MWELHECLLCFTQFAGSGEEWPYACWGRCPWGWLLEDNFPRLSHFPLQISMALVGFWVAKRLTFGEFTTFILGNGEMSTWPAEGNMTSWDVQQRLKGAPRKDLLQRCPEPLLKPLGALEFCFGPIHRCGVKIWVYPQHIYIYWIMIITTNANKRWEVND